MKATATSLAFAIQAYDFEAADESIAKSKEDAKKPEIRALARMIWDEDMGARKRAMAIRAAHAKSESGLTYEDFSVAVMYAMDELHNIERLHSAACHK